MKESYGMVLEILFQVGKKPSINTLQAGVFNELGIHLIVLSSNPSFTNFIYKDILARVLGRPIVSSPNHFPPTRPPITQNSPLPQQPGLYYVTHTSQSSGNLTIGRTLDARGTIA
jgi:hypothetical protein